MLEKQRSDLLTALDESYDTALKLLAQTTTNNIGAHISHLRNELALLEDLEKANQVAYSAAMAGILDNFVTKNSSLQHSE